MALDFSRARPLLQSGDLATLFREQLGWEPSRKKLTLRVADQDHALAGFAEKRGFTAWLCVAPDGRMPDHATRLKLERKLTETSFEHLIVFTTADRARQSWMWVRRETGKPLAVRTHEFFREQPGDSLLQKLDVLCVSFKEEEQGVTIGQMAGRARAAFDLERVTKSFYRDFDTHRKTFLKFIEGISEIADREWYASVMLNRLMFVYFIQKKRFLDDDRDYLRHRLQRCQQEQGKDKFYSFYRYFLLRLFHEGFGKRRKDRAPDLEKLLGSIPYLNGGLFDVHELEKPERYGNDIQIPDSAFKRIFDFFETWQWHLDERPLRSDNEISPDVLGYIFERYINDQAKMGAYYTKEDITDYIAKNTILPLLLDAARSRCKVAFVNPGGPTVWDLLRENPDRYIYPSIRHGTAKELPSEIAVGLDPAKPNLIARRKAWNKPAPGDYALPTEIWREVVARRQRYEELRRKLARGEVRDVSDFITLNLDLRLFAQDVITRCESSELLAAFWHVLAGRAALKSTDKPQPGLTILDPTCGSGAFLFAALNILEPLYEICLDRMDALLCEGLSAVAPEKRQLSSKGHPQLPHGKMAEFTAILDQVATHPNERYFIHKTIILHNLYGVDIMEEAVEICKLRLFLKLAAQVEPSVSKDNLGIEPLPDIDFNIRAGNTLVGYATRAELEAVAEGDWLLKGQVQEVLDAAEDAAAAYDTFVRSQLAGENPAIFKRRLQEKFGHAREQCNRFLAESDELGLAEKPQKLAAWKQSHRPFHWFVEFFGILNSGGFDVIIGNPPYLEVRQIDYSLRNYTSLDTGAIHAMCIERSKQLLHRHGGMSMIVPLSLPSTQRMQVVQQLLEKDRHGWYANYAWRPAKLFDTVNRALTIFVVIPAREVAHTYSTNYQKWTSDNRDGLFERLDYVEVPRDRPASWVPKLGYPIERSILQKCLTVKTGVKNYASKSAHRIYYRTDGGLYWKVFTDFAPAFNLNGKKGHSSRETWFTVDSRDRVRPVIAALSSGVFWWWYTVTSNLRHLNPFDVQNFPVPESALNDPKLRTLGERYLQDMERNSTMLVREQKQTGTTETQSFKIQKSKPIIDEIDAVLAKHYGFTEEELDFIINYDIKYRLGRGDDDDE